MSADRERREFEEEALDHLDALYGVGLRLTGGDEVRAEELVQETCLEAYRSRDDLEPGADCGAWLTTILRNRFIGQYRERENRPAPVENDDEDPGRSVFADVGGEYPAVEFFERIVDDEVVEAIEELDGAFRVPLVLSDLEGFGYREIAEVLGIPVDTVESRLHQARRRLLRRLYEHAREIGLLLPAAGGRDGRTDEGGRGGEGGGPPGGISCEEALSRVYEYLDGEAEPETQERIHRHLEICRHCYPYFDFERLFLDCVKEKGSAGERREGLEERVRRMLREEGA